MLLFTRILVGHQSFWKTNATLRDCQAQHSVNGIFLRTQTYNNYAQFSCYTHTNAQIQRRLSACATCLNGSSTVQWFNGPSLVLCKKLILEKSLKHNITNSISNNVNHHNNKGSKYNTINVIWNKLNNKPCSRWLADQLTLTLTFQLLPLL